MDELYNRELELQNKFNMFWGNVLKDKSDYYSKITDSQYVTLKKALKNINDIFTLKTTLALLDFLRKEFNMNEQVYEGAKKSLLSQKPNANGYDLRIDDIKLIAEVKCNIPINDGEIYGREQRYQIEKDIRYLLNGKKKVKDVDNNEYYKILGIYNFEGKSLKAIKNMLKVKKTKEEFENKVEIYDGNIKEFNKDKVYIVFVSIS